MPLPHDLVCAGVILGEVDDQRIEQNQRRLPEQRARCTDTGFRPMRTASAGSHFADGGRGDFAGEVHRPVPTDQKSAVRTKAADRGARAPDVHLAKDIAGHPRSTMRQTTRENSISICPLPARRYWWRWWPGPGSNRRPSAFQTDLCSDGTCLRWSNWTNARHSDVLDQLVRLVGPILARQIPVNVATGRVAH